MASESTRGKANMEGHENNGFVGDSPSIPGQFRWSTVIENGDPVHSYRRNSRSGDSVIRDQFMHDKWNLN